VDRGIALAFRGQHHAPAALPPGKTRYPLCRRLGGPQERSGRVRKIAPPPEFDPRTVQPVTSRYTEYRLSYRAHNKEVRNGNITSIVLQVYFAVAWHLLLLLSLLYCAGDKIDKNEMGGACSADRERRDLYRVLVGKSEGKRPLGRPRRRWEDNIKMDLQKLDVGVWTGLSWLRIDTGGGHLWMQ
jgi:hypothetical protein